MAIIDAHPLRSSPFHLSQAFKAPPRIIYFPAPVPYKNQANPIAAPAAVSRPLFKKPTSCPALAPLVVTVEGVDEAEEDDEVAVALAAAEVVPEAVVLAPEEPVAVALPPPVALAVAPAPDPPEVALALRTIASAYGPAPLATGRRLP